MDFTKLLMDWYSENKRDLPWRRTKDPYRVWLSEVILQQTRIDQGLPYYERFTEDFPTVVHLAEASEQEVLKRWQGLGYYSRARNLHAAARMIVERYKGVFPATYDQILELKGVGEYTAAAIASICFGEPAAVVDGNVIRFLSRVAGSTEPMDQQAGRKKIRDLANGFIDRDNPGDYNQALMEFGALVCTPTGPDCSHCIFRIDCVALRENMIDRIPVKNSKALVKHRYLHYLVLTFSDSDSVYLFLRKRTENDIWRNLYDFPCVELADSREVDLREAFGLPADGDAAVEFLGVSAEQIHQLTHQKIHARFYRFHALQKPGLPFLPVPLADIQHYPVPKLIDRYMHDHRITAEPAV